MLMIIDYEYKMQIYEKPSIIAQFIKDIYKKFNQRPIHLASAPHIILFRRVLKYW